MNVKGDGLEGPINACENRVAGRANYMHVKTEWLERANLCM